MPARGYIEINADKCKGCGLCISFCPQKLIRFSEKFNTKGYHPAEFHDPQKRCIACGFCYQMCPDTAITVYKIQGVAQNV
jgi:2-oxoglutarate ferredoxin oxidoreductase subunit delta